MNPTDRPITNLLAADFDGGHPTTDALQESRLSNDPGLVHDWEALFGLNLPRMDGREARTQIKATPELWRIPVVVPTMSPIEPAIYRGYDTGPGSYSSKPVTFSGRVNLLQGLGRYWFEIVQLPAEQLVTV